MSYMTQEDPDLSLVQALKVGEDQALNALMDRHREGLFRFVLRHVPNEADAIELAMETFVRAYFHIEKFRPAAKFATWLYHIALNLCRDHLRSRAYRDSLQTIAFDAQAQEAGDPSLLVAMERGPDQKTERLEELTALEKAIRELPEDLKPRVRNLLCDGVCRGRDAREPHPTLRPDRADASPGNRRPGRCGFGCGPPTEPGAPGYQTEQHYGSPEGGKRWSNKDAKGGPANRSSRKQ